MSDMTEKTTRFCCCKCGKTYSRKARLKVHETKEHGDIVSDDGNKMPCAVPGCKFSAGTRARMRVHLYTEHKLKVQRGILKFSNKTDFLNWKCAEERDQTSTFVATSAPKPLKNGSRKTYLACHRSATSKSPAVDPRAPGRRRQKASKSQGSCKTDVRCPASMDVEESADGSVRVVYYRTHCGHARSLAHQRLGGGERSAIAGQLAEGYTFDEILDDVQDSLGAEELSRKHLISRHDLWNIAKANGLTPTPSGSRQENDAIESASVENGHENYAASLGTWVEELRHIENIPVLFYKPQGMVSKTGLHQDDFIIVIMTNVQQEMLKQFGGDKICVETAHCTNEYGLYLSTIMVVDEFGSAFPAAFCCGNSDGVTTTTAMTHRTFFSSVLAAVGSVRCDAFVCDDDGGAALAAWSAVMGPPSRQRLCPWSVDAGWRRAGGGVEGGIERQAGIYKTLRLLLEETDVTNFQQLLKEALFQFSCDPDTAEFREYFLTHYANRAELWASCYHLQAGADCIASLESMHRVLKHVFSRSMRLKRVDKCLTALLRTTRDKSFERLRKLVARRADRRDASAQRGRHDRGAGIPDANVARSADGSWAVTARGWGGKTYAVRKSRGGACTGCPLACPACKACAHVYACTCVDSAADGNACEHAHKVASMGGDSVPCAVGAVPCAVGAVPCAVNGLDREEDDEVRRLEESIRVDATKCPTANEVRANLETRLECLLESVRGLSHGDGEACEEAGRLMGEATALVDRAVIIMVSSDGVAGAGIATVAMEVEVTTEQAQDPHWT